MVQTDAPDKVKEYLNLIQKNVNISEKIIADLLEFTRVKTAARERISISDLVHQTLERFPAPESIQVTLDLPADLPQVHVDPLQVVQVLGNLTLNACQAMKDGGQLSVISRQLPVISNQSSVETEPLITDNRSLITGDWILITVKDTGSGISPDNMKKLFEPLFTTKAKGIGLGLAVCQNLIEANGGRIEVESEVGVGSTFTLYLPLYRGTP
jgi:signal transduction histidine kinase